MVAGRPAKSLEKPIYYHVRLTRTDVNGLSDDVVLRWINCIGDNYLVVFEEADDEVKHPHYHIRVLSYFTKQKIQGECIKLGCMNVKNETQLSSVNPERDAESNLRYLLKGKGYCQNAEMHINPVVVGFHGIDYTEVFFMKYNTLYWRERREYQNSAAKQALLDKKTIKEKIDQAVTDITVKNEENIAFAIINVYVEMGKAVPEFQIEGLVKMYMCKHKKGYARNLAQRIASKCSFDHLNNNYYSIIGEEDL